MGKNNSQAASSQSSFAEDTFRLLVEATENYAIFILNSEGIIKTWNIGAAKIFGFKREEILGKHFSCLYSKNDAERKLPAQELQMAQEKNFYEEQVEYRVKKNGIEFPAHVVINVIHSKDGEITYGNIIQDLTDHTMMEELLKKQNEELLVAKEAVEAANNAKSIFLSAMTNEIRTPLHSLTSMTELLLETTLTEEQRQDLEIIRTSEKQLLFVIDNILDFTKVESGPVSFEDVQFELAKIVNDLVKSLSKQTQKKGIDVFVNIGTEVPPYLKGDPLRIRQILNNLLDNAIKFTQKGKIDLNIKVAQALKPESESQEESKISLLFEVVDTGIGFSAEVKKKLFQPFIQGDASISRKYGGTGLGLIISKKLIEAMGGIIEVESMPQQGTKFWFVIPLKIGKPSVAKDSYKAIAKQFPISDEDKKNFRILLAEDNETNKEIALRILKKFGYHADTVTNGIEVLKALESQVYDLILMDCQMPEMDGYTATETIRQLEQKQGKERVPIVAMTANALIGDEEKCLAIGMDDYFSKPLNINRFGEILDGWLSLKLAKEAKSISKS